MTNLFSNYGLCAARLVLFAGMVSGLGAWDDGSDRTEFVTRGAGDAVEVNKAVQTVNPWPPYVRSRRIDMDGKRAGLAIQRYQANRVVLPHPLNPTKAPELPTPDLSNVPPPSPQPQQ